VKNILVVGGGLIGARHMRSVAAHPHCRLAGLVDPDPNITSDASTSRFASMGEVRGEVDGVIIATPTHLHAEHGIVAAQRGWHMLIEKPVAGDIAQARMLQDAIKAAGVGSLVGHHRRYHLSVNHLKHVIAEGVLGEIVTVSLIWAMRKPDDYFQGNWRTAGGSPVMINLVHDIDILRYTIGEISKAVALRGRDLRGAGRIESGAVALSFENGATGTISFSDTTPSPWGFEAATGENPNIGTTRQDMLWITGTKGAVSFPSLTRWSGASDWSSAAAPIHDPLESDSRAPLDRQLDHFIEVMDGARPLIDVEDGTRTLEVAFDIEEQLRRSAT
jgi:predicted dehydrogenase